QAEDGIRYFHVTGVQTCALPILICVQPQALAVIKRPESRSNLRNQIAFLILLRPAERDVIAVNFGDRYFRYKFRYRVPGNKNGRSEERRVGNECAIRARSVRLRR